MAESGTEARHRHRHRLRGPWHWAARAAVVLALAAAVEYAVLPQLPGAERSLRLLTSVQPWWVAGGVVMEALSLVSYSLLSLRILPDRGRSLFWMIRTDVSGLALSHLVPGGAAAGNALRFRLLRATGSPVEEATVGVTLESIGSVVALLAILWLGLVAAIVRYGPSPTYLSAILAGAVVVGTALLVRGPLGDHLPTRRIGRALARAVPRRFRARVVGGIRSFNDDLTRLLANRQAMRQCVIWAAGNWCCDAASLWLFLAAFGIHMDPVGLIVAYGLANTVGALPITPGGLGLVEGTLIPGLIAFGSPASATLLGVLSWRLFEFWLPIPIGGLFYLSLRAQAHADPAGRTAS